MNSKYKYLKYFSTDLDQVYLVRVVYKQCFPGVSHVVDGVVLLCVVQTQPQTAPL